jgi:hypothetical protein
MGPRRGLRRIRRLVGGGRPPSGARVQEIPLDHCRTLGPLAFPCGPESRDPMAATLVAYRLGSCTGYEGSPLERFFELWQPATLAEVVGIDPAVASGRLLAPATGDTPPLPWKPTSHGAHAAGRLDRTDLRRVAQQIGVSPETLRGSIFYGPVSSDLGRVTFQRLVELHDSIRRRGFRPGRGGRPHLDGQLLVRDGDFRVVIVSGKHRMAALSALGYERAPVLLGHKRPPVVLREEAASWPHVVSGTYELEQALDVFDRIFDGVQPMELVLV